MSSSKLSASLIILTKLIRLNLSFSLTSSLSVIDKYTSQSPVIMALSKLIDDSSIVLSQMHENVSVSYTVTAL